MTEPKFTKGPWSAQKESGGSWLVYSDECEVVSKVIQWSEPVDRADAHLIAAAPELYEALVEIRDMLWSRPDISDRLRPLMGPGELAANQKAIAALAKARGEQ